MLNSLKILPQIIGFKPRGEHIVICGNSRGGTTLLYNMVRSAQPDALMPPREMRAVKLAFDPHPLIITKRPLDVFEIDKIKKRNGLTKKLHFVIVVRDPRSLVSSQHKSVPGDYFQGFDHTHFISDRGISYTNAGIVDCFSAIDRALADPDIEATVIKYEDLVRNPDDVQAGLTKSLNITWNSRFSDFHKSDIPEALSRALNGIRPVDPALIDAWKCDARALRVFQQFTLEPKLFSILEKWGYEQDRSWFDDLAHRFAPDVREPGVVIGFYTRGTFYEEEARRMAMSARKQGLDVELTPVESTGSWVRNASMKARFLYEQRCKRTGPLLYVDVDSIFRVDPWPYLLTKDGDLAIHVSRDGEMISATLLMNDTDGVRALLLRWADACDAAQDIWDQKVLQEIIETDEGSGQSEFRVQRLPAAFCWIFDSMPEPTYGQVVIEQLQASREANKKTRLLRPMSKKLKRRMNRLQEISDEYGF